MPSMREHLIFKALAALDEVRQASKDGPIRGSWQLRFCLAFLFSQSNGSRAPFEFFWGEMVALHPSSTDDGRYLRNLHLTRAICHIIQDLGFNDTPVIVECLRRPQSGRSVHDFWEEVQRQLDDGRPMPSPRFRRDGR